jgi:hypothetical protein
VFEQTDFVLFKKAFSENESEFHAVGDAKRVTSHSWSVFARLCCKNLLKRHLPFAAPLGANRRFLYVWLEFYGVDTFLLARM